MHPSVCKERAAIERESGALVSLFFSWNSTRRQEAENAEKNFFLSANFASSAVKKRAWTRKAPPLHFFRYFKPLATGTLEQCVGRLIADALLRLRIEFQRPTDAIRQIAQVS